MAIQPLYNGPFYWPSSQLVSAYSTTQVDPPIPSNVTVDTPNAGNVLYNKATDYTDPSTIHNITTDFSKSINPVTSNTLLVQLGVDPQPFGKNPSSIDVLKGTVNAIDLIKDPNIGANVRPRANSDPFTWRNPTALDIFVGVSATSGSLLNSTGSIATPASVITQTSSGPVVLSDGYIPIGTVGTGITSPYTIATPLNASVSPLMSTNMNYSASYLPSTYLQSVSMSMFPTFSYLQQQPYTGYSSLTSVGATPPMYTPFAYSLA